MLRVLMNRFHEGREDLTLEGMNQEDQQVLLGTKITSKDVAPACKSSFEALSHIHHSWLDSKIKLPLKALSKVEEFLFEKQYPLLGMEEVLPAEYLESTPLTPLISLKKGELVDLIDFLGIYDLAEEVKHVIDKKKLMQIYETLTPKKHELLRRCMHLRDRLVTKRINIERWDGDHEKLNSVLYERGIRRLGVALSGDNPDFIWHVVHILDVGRGTDLMKHINKDENPQVVKFVTTQVLNTIKYLKG